MIKKHVGAFIVALFYIGAASAQEGRTASVVELNSVQLESTPEYNAAALAAAEAEVLLGLCAGQPAAMVLTESEKIDLVLLTTANYARGAREVAAKLGELPDGQAAQYGVFTDALKLRELGCGDDAGRQIMQGYIAAQELGSLAPQLLEDRQASVRKVLGGAISKVINTAFTHLQCLNVGQRPADFVNAELASFRPFFDQSFAADVSTRSFGAMFGRHPMQFAYFDKLEEQAKRENPDNPIVDRSCGPRVEIWTSLKTEASSLAMSVPDSWRLDTNLGSRF